MRLHAGEFHVNEPKKGTRMDKVNWDVFQATAALLAPQVAGAPTQQAHFDAVQARFLNLYRGLELIARQIEAEEGEAHGQSGH